MGDHLRLEFEGAVAHLSIDRADRRNAFNQAMWEAMPGLIEAAVAPPAVRAVILRAAEPGVFCAGADIAEFATKAPDAEWRRVNQAAIARTQIALARAAKPVIAVIDGDCVGGGCGLALAADIRVASPRARFGITPAKLGLVYSLHDTKLLVDLVGPAQAKRILFTAGLLDAAEATRIGLVTMLADDPLPAALALAAQIAATSPFTHRHAKAIVRRILDGESADSPETAALFDSAFTGADFQEGVAAFLAKRAPVFADR
ncbi:enoyl-CoA hydratase-related protein [Sandaracinobacteroides saxicola]|uniref:Enoyl-CoA hydratase/isomerase family protein n=1 Tax=Sandaracinobacteroides saxicola TaxID=2759707 RepID=A0A7G5IGQ7_9SPHN|nr:enoyl-CoA hydratase-related protein [Sandaracinobacteroides saxicola]QMW22549.1 enoyl-CoA hydratase/isomerase family protein [Sandaracinobacteroides saxicola]